MDTNASLQVGTTYNVIAKKDIKTKLGRQATKGQPLFAMYREVYSPLEPNKAYGWEFTGWDGNLHVVPVAWFKVAR